MDLTNNPQTLDDLFARAEHYAEFSMRKSGSVPPTLFVIGADGLGVLMPQNLEDDKAKDDFATSSKLMCIAHDAKVAVLVLEAWAKIAEPGETIDTAERPSESMDRR